MKRGPVIAIIVLSVLVVGLTAVLAFQLFIKPAASVDLDDAPPSPTPTTTPTTTPTAAGDFTSEGGTPITLDEWSEAPVASPLTLSGEVPGTWSSGGSFPVQVTDEDGNVLAEAIASLEGDWMTEEMVPFSVTVTFDEPPGDSGFLVLKKENPSGLPENDDTLRIPVAFA